MKEYKDYFFKNIKKMFSDFKNPESRKKQIPNYLTFSRALAPLFIIPSVLTGNLPLALAFTGGFALTDAFDGYYARKYNAISEFGKDLDPICDKIFATGLIIPLIFSSPILLLNLVGEVLIGSISSIARLAGQTSRTAMIGKVKTTSLSLLIAASYANLIFGVNPIILSVLFASTITLQLATVAKYYERYQKNLKANIRDYDIEKIDFDVDKEIEKDRQLEKMKQPTVFQKTANDIKNQDNSLQEAPVMVKK